MAITVQYTYYIYLSICWLVVTGPMEFYDFPFSWEFPSIPTDELIFFRGVAQPPESVAVCLSGSRLTSQKNN